MSKKVYIVNAFTAEGQNGNPAGVVLGADDLSEQDMLRIAASIGLSETAFVSKSTKATRRVRFFTPTVEVPLCGHATIATWSLLHQLSLVPVGMHTQETGAGVLKVTVRDDGLVFMEQATAEFFDEIAPVEVAGFLGIDVADFDMTLRPQIVSTGLRDLLVPVANRQVVAKLQPDLEGIAAFSRQHDISGFHVFAMLGKELSLAAARNFAPADGIPEECATGTSNGAMLCYLRANNVLPQQATYRIEQGEAMGRLSYIYGTFKGARIWIGGEATTIEQKNI
jgi:PhzF family phenazine biosynthesis protein